VRLAELYFRYYYLHLLAGRAVAVYLSLFNFNPDALLSSLCRYHHLFQSRYLDIVNAWCDQRSI
jgi:hypothetical protein